MWVNRQVVDMVVVELLSGAAVKLPEHYHPDIASLIPR